MNKSELNVYKRPQTDMQFPLESKLLYQQNPENPQTPSTPERPAQAQSIRREAANDNMQPPWITRQILQTRGLIQMYGEGLEDVVIGGVQLPLGLVEWNKDNLIAGVDIIRAFHNRPSRIIQEITKATGRAIGQVVWKGPTKFIVRSIEGVEQTSVGVMGIAGATFGKIRGLMPFITPRGPRDYDPNIATPLVDGFDPRTRFNWSNTQPDVANDNSQATPGYPPRLVVDNTNPQPARGAAPQQTPPPEALAA